MQVFFAEADCERLPVVVKSEEAHSVFSIRL